MGNFSFPVHDRRRSRDMASMSRETAFAADSMIDRLEARKRLLIQRRQELINVHGFYTSWPAWDKDAGDGALTIRAAGGSPTISTSSVVGAFQPDPDDPTDRVGHIATAWLEVIFQSGSSVGTGVFGFTLPRAPRIANGVLGYYTGQADSSPFLYTRGVCVHNVIGGVDCVSMYQHGAGLLSNTNPGTWDMNTAYLILNLRYEIEV